MSEDDIVRALMLRATEQLRDKVKQIQNAGLAGGSGADDADQIAAAVTECHRVVTGLRDSDYKLMPILEQGGPQRSEYYFVSELFPAGTWGHADMQRGECLLHFGRTPDDAENAREAATSGR